VPLRIVVTSRPELHIRLGFREMPNGTYQDLVLHEVPRSTIEHNIRLFLEHKLGVIRKERMLSSDWPAKYQILALVELAVPLFIYAAIVCRYINIKGRDPKKYLNKVLEYGRSTFSQLDWTYLPVLEQLLAEQEEDEIKCQLDFLHSVLSVPDSENVLIRLLHLSFREFLVDPLKQGRSPFWVDEKSTHSKLASRCLELMSGHSGLRQDMCSLVSPGVLRSEINDGAVASSLPPGLQYACRY
jgi:hypothetical protein